ncbi:centromere protein P isoform X3 [Megalobrama amblycephala]|uniref:centromere protein P isoform X3 n=1 Tax=Megalobrama amblycephala TaxID=75352 RepID=UPI00201452B4|nr:centromere protein P isoform X3 [Megalobrama amblycephala]
MEQKYEDEIQMLHQEIEMLEAEQEEVLRSIFIQHGDRLQEELKSVCEEKGGGGAHKHALSKLNTEIRELEKDLRRQTEINEIALNECFVKTLHKSERKLVQQLRLAGHCSVLLFQVEFAVTEIQEGDALLRRVTELNIVVDGVEFKDFSAFVSRVEDTKDLLLFFRTLRTFSERCEERRQTFQHFQRLQACETVGVLAEDDRISIHTDLVHVGTDVKTCSTLLPEGEVSGQSLE